MHYKGAVQTLQSSKTEDGHRKAQEVPLPQSGAARHLQETPWRMFTPSPPRRTAGEPSRPHHGGRLQVWLQRPQSRSLLISGERAAWISLCFSPQGPERVLRWRLPWGPLGPISGIWHHSTPSCIGLELPLLFAPPGPGLQLCTPLSGVAPAAPSQGPQA